MTAVQSAYAVFRRFEETAALLAGFAMMAVMLIGTADVLMRYLLSAPFIWSHDFVRLYLVPALVYFAASGAFQNHAHISVDLMHYAMGPRTRHLCLAVCCLLAAAMFGMITVSSGRRSLGEFADGDVLTGVIAWPTWPSSALVAFGAALLTLRTLAHGILHLSSLAAGRDLIELPALATGEH